MMVHFLDMLWGYCYEVKLTIDECFNPIKNFKFEVWIKIQHANNHAFKIGVINNYIDVQFSKSLKHIFGWVNMNTF